MSHYDPTDAELKLYFGAAAIVLIITLLVVQCGGKESPDRLKDTSQTDRTEEARGSDPRNQDQETK